MTTLYAAMRQFMELKVAERAGGRQHPAIQWAHELCRMGEGVADEVAWCSSIINLAAALTKRKRSHSAAARSWLNPGLGMLNTNPASFREHLSLMQMASERDAVLIFRRGGGRGALGADVVDAPGHVAVFANYPAATTTEGGILVPTLKDHVDAIGGNQGNTMSIQKHRLEDLIGILVVENEAIGGATAAGRQGT